jgi:hypothetical protein
MIVIADSGRWECFARPRKQGVIDVPETLSRLKATSFYIDDDLLNVIFGDWMRG